jgi:hypothetical protein
LYKSAACYSWGANDPEYVGYCCIATFATVQDADGKWNAEYGADPDNQCGMLYYAVDGDCTEQVNLNGPNDCGGAFANIECQNES